MCYIKFVPFQIDEFHVNDRVHVMKDKELVKKLQRGHGEWTNEMTVVIFKDFVFILVQF